MIEVGKKVKIIYDSVHQKEGVYLYCMKTIVQYILYAHLKKSDLESYTQLKEQYPELQPKEEDKR